MIKTYKYNEICNNVSITLSGSSGNTMRYNFTHGNTFTRKCPEITLRNKYAQDLLESHELFKTKKVSLVTAVAEPSDVVEDDSTPKAKKEKDVVEIPSVVSASDLLEFVNKEDNRTESNMFKTPGNALKWAFAHNFAFPNYNPE